VRLAVSEGETARLSGQMSIIGIYEVSVAFAREATAANLDARTPFAKFALQARARIKPGGSSPIRQRGWTPPHNPARRRQAEFAVRETK
jgi:hypothetical protein